ncbi:ABC transporter ATP-binding protein [Deinococcus maricopensis DSM 21211]|uniref:ABC transporter ATP-binding protein n=1 Tax=Deinococcus maricopensis (strain DSM 21211 / LMG 22137 / NRRL B-23946 / LB-34) TaxID=709986 RepID=E8UC77_DEIML|nr:ABC transporter ATP-binding protein [Deinococcus maricopensis DSM 21211]
MSVPARGRVLVGTVPAVRARSRVAFLPGVGGLDPAWSLSRAVRVVNGLVSTGGARVGVTRLVETAESLGVRTRVPVGRLPWAERARAGLALTLAREATLFVLDDPFRGATDVALAQRVAGALEDAGARGALVVSSGLPGWRADAPLLDLGGRA